MKTLAFFGANGWLEDAVGVGDTRRGYADWVMAQHEEAGLPFAPDPAVGADAAPEPDDAASTTFPEEEWQAEVEALDTRLSYAAWVAHRQEAEA